MLKYWLPVFVWMALIFSASSDTASGHRSSRIIGPIVRWLVPDISEADLEMIVFSVRKTAHLAEYAVLALLLFRALYHSRSVRMRPFGDAPAAFPRSVALLAFSIAALYAITDEFHQSFVPSRQGQVLDVHIDSLGAALGLAAAWAFGRWRKYW